MIHNKYYEIIAQFLGDFNRRIYGRELIGKISLGQKNIALALNDLEKEGVLSSETRGNMKYFFLNKKNPLCERYLLLAEIMRSLLFMDKNTKLKEILSEISSQADIVCVFGSYAKAIPKKSSDLDLFLVGKFNKREIKKIGENYGVEISIKGGSKNDFVRALKEDDLLINEILKDHILISGYEQFLKEVIKQKW